MPDEPEQKIDEESQVLKTVPYQDKYKLIFKNQPKVQLKRLLLDGKTKQPVKHVKKEKKPRHTRPASIFPSVQSAKQYRFKLSKYSIKM